MSKIIVEDGPNGSKEPSEFTWRGAPTLRRVRALNERCLEALTQIARSDRQQASLVIVSQHRALWRALNGTARKRAADMPFLLMDMRFQDVQWWRVAQDPRLQRRRYGIHNAAFPGKVAAELMRETLMLAWSTALFDRGAASVLLGMAPAVCEIIAEFGPQDVERIAARYSRHVRPRWHEFPAFWGELLHAARAGDEEALYESRLHGVQLTGGELLASLEGRPL